jgi:hypothetical protein
MMGRGKENPVHPYPTLSRQGRGRYGVVLNIRILNLPALLSRFRVTCGLMYHDPSGKSKVIDFGRNYLTG